MTFIKFGSRVQHCSSWRVRGQSHAGYFFSLRLRQPCSLSQRHYYCRSSLSRESQKPSRHGHQLLMASDISRKRKHSDSLATFSPRSRAFEGAASEAHGICHGIIMRDIQDGQSFVHPTVQDHARAHFGNNYNITNSKTEITPEEIKYQAIKDALKFPRMDFRHAAIDPAYGETCQWIFEHEHFSRWRDPAFRESNHGLLWIRGSPGRGSRRS
jgi:hypothetical protein